MWVLEEKWKEEEEEEEGGRSELWDMQSVVNCSCGDRVLSLSCVNGFSCSWEETKAGSRAESHSVQWGTSSGCEGRSTGVCWQTTKTWEREKITVSDCCILSVCLSVCLSVGESCCHTAPKLLNNFPHGIRSEIFQDFQSISLSLRWTSLTLLKTNFVYADMYVCMYVCMYVYIYIYTNIYLYSSMLSNSWTQELPFSPLND